MKNILSLENVSKNFKDTKALDNISINIFKGDIYGLIGKNGAGKSTILKLILNLIKPTKGKVTVLGEEITKESYKYLKNIGALVEEPRFYNKLSLWENFKIHCEYLGFYDEKHMKDLLKSLDLLEKEKERISSLSLGEKKKLALGYALVTTPEILILDEPTNGLDPIAIVKLRENLKKINRKFGTTIIIASHDLKEIEDICSRIALINKGKLLGEGTLEDIKERANKYIEIETNNIEKAMAVLERSFNVKKVKVMGDSLIRLYEGFSSRGEIIKTLALEDVEILSFKVIEESLEDYFIKVLQEVESYD